MVNEGNDLKHDTALKEKGFQFKKNVRNSFTHTLETFQMNNF